MPNNNKPNMKDFVSCFTQNAVNVLSPSSCSSTYSISNNASCIISPTLTPSIQNSISTIYKSLLSTTLKTFLITVTWCKNHSNQGLNITFAADNNNNNNVNLSLPSFRLNTNSRFFRKKKGSKLLDSSSDNEIIVLWDLSNASYDSSGPEPIEGYYVIVIIDSEICLLLGDMAEEAVSKKLKITNTTLSVAKVTLISRREYCSGSTVYTTKAQFCESGTWHDVLIKCSVENEGLKSPVLTVSIDKKMVIRVKRLQWNFRGNQTIFVDGLLVDLLWDVHDWFFSNPSTTGSDSGYAVFMFRTRNGLDSRLWLEEKSAAQKDKDRIEFSLLIYACKTS